MDASLTELADFVEVVHQMRMHQQQYFSACKKGRKGEASIILPKAIALEKEVDDQVRRFKGLLPPPQQASLFS